MWDVRDMAHKWVGLPRVAMVVAVSAATAAVAVAVVLLVVAYACLVFGFVMSVSTLKTPKQSNNPLFIVTLQLLPFHHPTSCGTTWKTMKATSSQVL